MLVCGNVFFPLFIKAFLKKLQTKFVEKPLIKTTLFLTNIKTSDAIKEIGNNAFHDASFLS